MPIGALQEYLHVSLLRCVTYLRLALIIDEFRDPKCQSPCRIHQFRLETSAVL